MGNNLPTISATESLVMDFLLGGERFGLELVEQSGGTLKRGSVYVILSRMEAKGFVTSRLDDRPQPPAGPTRRLYAATPYGRRCIRPTPSCGRRWPCGPPGGRA
jgi:DNA-binding PadR family transcriptional regulator